MTSLVRARIIPADSSAPMPEAAPPMLRPDEHRRIAREVVLARESATRLVEEARAKARAIVAEARKAAEAMVVTAAAEARQAEEAKFAARYLWMKREEERRAEADLDRAIGLAMLLSERLLGEALVREPHHVVALARQALAEARGVRQVVIDASPLDAEVLRRHLVEVGFAPHSVEIRTDDALERGSLRLNTSLGNLDAQLRPQLERLARALRDAL